MFAESGAPPPPGLGTGTPEQVGKAVVHGGARNPGSPRSFGATKAADAIADGQTDKR